MILIKSIALVVLVSTIALSCKKANKPPTQLIITVTDQYLNPITNYPAGIQVYLYTNKADFGSANKGIESVPTDKNGNATFPNLSPIQYYFWAQGACGSNSGSDTATSGAIPGGMTTVVSTVFYPQNGCIP